MKGSVLRYMPLFVFVLLPSLTAGCATAKAYSGPKRPESELSTVFFHASPAVSLSAMAFDGKRKALSAAGCSALPGRHSYNVNYNLARASGLLGTCRGDFTSEAGKEYIIDVVGVGDSASVSVYTDGRRGAGDFGRLPLTLRCRPARAARLRKRASVPFVVGVGNEDEHRRITVSRAVHEPTAGNLGA